MPGLDRVVELGLDPAGVDAERARRGREGRVVEHHAVEGHDGRHAVDDQLGQRAPGPLQGLLAVDAGDDDLGDQRVEAARHGHARAVALVDPDARAERRDPARQRARRGQEAAARVLGVDPELDRVPAGDRVAVAELLAVGDAEHLAHEVEPGDLLGDRVLDLQAGVHLEEGDGAVLADEELAGPRADVAGLGEDRLGRRCRAARPGRR